MDDLSAIGLLFGLFLLLGMGAVLAFVLMLVEGVLNMYYEDTGDR